MKTTFGAPCKDVLRAARTALSIGGARLTLVAVVPFALAVGVVADAARAAEPEPMPERAGAEKPPPAEPDEQAPPPKDKPKDKDKDKPRPARVDGDLAERREKAQALVRRAQSLAVTGRREEAIEQLTAALEAYPAYPLAHHELGVTLAEQGNLPEAEASLRRALDLAPDFVRAQQALGEVLRRQKKYGEALDLYKRVLAREPADLASWYGVAASLRAQKKTGEALFALKKLVASAKNPDAPAVVEARKEIAALEKAGIAEVAWNEEGPGTDERPMTASAPGALQHHVGDEAFQERRYVDALNAYKKQWKAKTPDGVLAYKIGATFAVMNDLRSALTWWRAALSAEPGRELIARHLAIVVGKVREVGGPATSPDEQSAVVRAREALRQGDPGTALFLVRGLDAPGAATLEAEARLRLGDFDRARAIFEEVLGEDPDDRVAKGGLAEALLRLGQGGAADKAIQAWVGAEGSEGGYKARPETFLVFRRGEVDARLLAPPEPEE